MLNWRMNHKAAGRFDTWNNDPVVTTALWWKALVELGRQDGKRLGDDAYCEVRYEELVADPVGQCHQIARFLSLPYAKSMVSYYDGRSTSYKWHVGERRLSSTHARAPRLAITDANRGRRTF